MTVGEQFALGTPWALLGLIPVLTLVGLRWWLLRSKRYLTVALPGLANTRLPASAWQRIAWLPSTLGVLALILSIVALARPQVVAPPAPEETEGIDIVLAVDTSCSMRAADFQPKDRISVAKRSILEFIQQRTQDRIGLVVFGAEAASWVPLTLDYSLLSQMLEEVEVGMLEDGTAIGTAIATSLNRLRRSEAASKVVILLTDGDSNRGVIAPMEAADFAKELNVKVFTILIGKGGLVPVPVGKDPWGRAIMRKHKIPTDPKLLADIAERTGGEAYHATDKSELDAGLSKVLDTLETSKLESTGRLEPRVELYPPLLAIALLLLLLAEMLLATRLGGFP